MKKSVRGALRAAMAAGAIMIALPLGAAWSQAPALGAGGIKGFVHDSMGLGIVGVQITMPGSALRAETDDRGEFELAKIIPGPVTLQFRRLGYRPDTIEIEVSNGRTVPLNVRIDRVATTLAPVVVNGHSALTGWRAGFYLRKEHGSGHFFTREDFEQRNPPNLTDMFRTIPGARIVSMGIGGFQRVVRFRGSLMNCAPLTWLDGSPLAAAEFDLDALSPRSIEAMEVYSGPATVPPQFMSVRGVSASCGTIVIWTRDSPPRPRKRATNEISPALQIDRLVASHQVWTAADVDVPAHEDSLKKVQPFYPDALFDAGVGGSVMAEFVVDAAGEVALDTFSLVYSTDPAFTAAVAEALRNAIYVPAVRKGYPVMQVVQHEFKFVADSALARRKK